MAPTGALGVHCRLIGARRHCPLSLRRPAAIGNCTPTLMWLSHSVAHRLQVVPTGATRLPFTSPKSNVVFRWPTVLTVQQ